MTDSLNLINLSTYSQFVLGNILFENIKWIWIYSYWEYIWKYIWLEYDQEYILEYIKYEYSPYKIILHEHTHKKS